MKVLIISDSHRKDNVILNIIKHEEPFDMLIHLGDIEGGELKLNYSVGIGTSLVIIKGNNDFFSDLPDEKELRIGTHKILLSHGHSYGVSLDLESYRTEALSRGCDIAMFGHTHKPVIDNKNGVLLINPGSVAYPRQSDRRATYVILEITDEKAEAKIKYVDEINPQDV